MTRIDWVSCHDCDALYRVGTVPSGAVARCARCGGQLFHASRDTLDRTLAMAIAGAVLFLGANTYPLLTFEMQGNATRTTLGSGVVNLWEQGRPSLAVVVAVTAIVAPLVQLSTLLYLLVPLRLGRVPMGLAHVFRLMRRIQPWSMMDVFLLGILVSLVKLADMADIVAGLALYCFGILILVVAAANASLEPRAIWRRVEELS